jgi:DNA-binding transcriptional MocR family regulator
MTIATSGLASRLGRPGPGPAYLWLAERLRAEILDGRLLVGHRVPSERAVAESLQLSRTTVTAAFDLLRAEGFLLSRPGSNTVANLPRPAVARPDADATSRPDAIDLTVAAPAAPAMLSGLAHEAATRLGAYSSAHGLHPLGIPELRAAVAARFTDRGLPTSSEQILITQGALHGWDLLLRTLARPGSAVLIEQPTYPGVNDAATAHGLRVRPLAVDHDGWDLAALQTDLADALFVHVTPDHQNPTGLVATAAQRAGLLSAVSRGSGRTPMVVVDETFAELRFAGPADGEEPAPLATFGGEDRTVTLGSLSKSVWAGLRIGWIRARPDLIRRISMSRAGQDLASPVMDQLMAVEALRRLPEILAERVAVLRIRCEHLLGLLAAHAPTWRAEPPGGGLVLWVDLAGASSRRLAQDCQSLGVLITPGSRFSTTGSHDRFVRLPFCNPEPVTERAVGLIVQAAGRQSSDQGPARSGRGTRQSGIWTA